MNDWDAYPDDMTKAHRSDIDSGNRAADAHLDAILSGEDLPLDADPTLRGLAASLSALTAASEQQSEQDVPERVRDAYRDAFATSNLSEEFDRKSPRRRSMRKSLVSARAAAVALVTGGVSLGGLTAAYAGALPDAAQNIAHHAIGAPAAKPPHPSATPVHHPAATPHHPAPTPVGPAGSGHSAYGLCTAWKHAHDSGKAGDAPAFRNLVAAAGGADQVDGYCAAVFATKDSERGKHHVHTPAAPKPTPVPQDKKTHKTPPGKAHSHGQPEHPTSTPTATPPGATKSHSMGKPDAGHAQGHDPVGVPARTPQLGGEPTHRN